MSQPYRFLVDPLKNIEPAKRKSLVCWTVVAVFCIVAFANCHLNIQQALPYGDQGDEKFYVIRSLRMVFTGDLNPHWFGHPASLWIYTLTFFFWIYKVFGLAPAAILE